jgi:hypothetical protein
MGHFEAINLAETKEQLGKIYDLLTSLCKGETATETAVATKENPLLNCKLKMIQKIYHSKNNLKKNAMASYRF